MLQAGVSELVSQVVKDDSIHYCCSVGGRLKGLVGPILLFPLVYVQSRGNTTET